MMRRIKPQEVLAAYRKTGLKPVRRKFGGKTCGCPATAMYVAAHGGKNGTRNLVINWMAATYGGRYASGFFAGVDGFPEEACSPTSFQGWADGKQVARAVFGEGT